MKEAGRKREGSVPKNKVFQGKTIRAIRQQLQKKRKEKK